MDVADRSWELRTGKAMILPAASSIPSRFRLVHCFCRSASVPRTGRPYLPTPSRPCSSPPTDELALLHTFVAAYTPLRPRGHDSAMAFDIIATGPLAQPVSNTSPTASIATRLAATTAARPADPRTLDEWAQEFGTDAASCAGSSVSKPAPRIRSGDRFHG